MFGLFNKKQRAKEGMAVLKAVVSQLPSKYSYLVPQVSEEFILDIATNPTGEKGAYTLSLNSKLEKKFFNKKLPGFFIIQNILIWDSTRKSYVDMELDIVDGILSGYKFVPRLNDIDINKVDVSSIKEKHFQNEDKNKVLEIFKGIDDDFLPGLDIEETFKIELPEGDFYMIKDFRDGNYLAVNEEGAVFGLIHDPYEVQKLFDNKDEFIDALRNGSFNIQKYYATKFS